MDAKAGAARRRVYETLDAVHFCIATTSGTHRSLDPSLFATRLSEQLSMRLPHYGEWLLAQAGRQSDISVRQVAGSVSGTMIGVVVEHLGAKDPASIFSSVLEPLSAIPVGQVVVLVDALDEAELWPVSPTISELIAGAVDGGATEQIRFLVTTRPSEAVTNRFPEHARWDLIEDAGSDAADVLTYTSERFAQAVPDADPDLVRRFAAASQGNFLYAKTALDYWLPRLSRLDPAEPLDLPRGLDGIYASFLQREYGSKDGATRWKTASKPLLGTLGVAQQKLGDAQLQFILNIAESDGLQEALQQCEPYLEGERPDGPFDLYHQSFREFLFDPRYNRKFLLSAADANARTATRYFNRYHTDWSLCFDDYGLRYPPIHIAEAARRYEQPRRDDLVRQLVTLVSDPGFRQAHEQRLGDIASLQRDLERSLKEACRNDAPGAVRLVLDAAREFQAFRDEQTDPARVFAAAEAGDLGRAEKYLDIFFAEPHWHRASLLVSAWLAVDRSRNDARALVARLAEEPLYIDPLPMLFDRVTQALLDAPPRQSRPA